MGLRSTLKKKAMGMSAKAMEHIFADEKRAQRFAEAVGAVQRGKKAFDDGQTMVMHQFSFATKGDFKSLGKQLSNLRRRAKALDDKLAKL